MQWQRPQRFPVIAIIASLLYAGNSLADPCSNTHDFTPGRFDPQIPNFAKKDNINNKAINSGPWSVDANWSAGHRPLAGEIVCIGGQTIIYDTISDAAIKTISVQDNGALKFRNDKNTRLTVENLVILDGTLEIGNKSNRIPQGITAEVVFPDTALDKVNDPLQYGHGLLAFGNVTMYGAEKVPYIRFKDEPKKGMTNLQLVSSPDGWVAGDDLHLHDSQSYIDTGSGGAWHVETAKLSGTTANSINVPPLAYDHPGARDDQNIIRYTPFVANMTRNIIFRSANPNGTRGIVMFLDRANVDIRYAAFNDLGRTTLEQTAPGTNQAKRYSVYFRHVIGPSQPPATEYQFMFEGNSVIGGRRGIVLEDSHYGRIGNNVVVNAVGTGILASPGMETDDLIVHNYVSFSMGNGSRGDEPCGVDENNVNIFGCEGNGIRVGGPNCRIRDNFVSNSGMDNYLILIERQGEYRYPSSPGDDPLTDFKTFIGMGTPLKEFAYNETGGVCGFGFSMWNVGAVFAGTAHDVGESIIDHLTIWNMKSAVFPYYTNRFVYQDYTALGDWQLALGGVFTSGWGGTDYLQGSEIFRRANIQGFRFGMQLPIRLGSTQDTGEQMVPFTIEDSYFSNYQNFYSVPPGDTGAGRSNSPMRYVFSNVKFGPQRTIPGDDRSSPWNLALYYLNEGLSNIFLPFEIFFYKYNGIEGKNYKVFWPQAHPDYRITGPYPQGISIPIDGMTNQQAAQGYAWVLNDQTRLYDIVPRTSPDQRGASIFSEIASCFDMLEPTISGFTCPIPSGTNQLPHVTAGSNQTIVFPNNSASLHATVTDDGLPTPTQLTILWVKSVGPGDVVFSSPNSADTTATFSMPGVYVLRCSANDGAGTSGGVLTVTVTSNPNDNSSPQVKAGPDQTIAAGGTASLSGSATDDGKPVPPGKLTNKWIVSSGPGAVVFGNDASPVTTARPTAGGTYTLRLTADDGALSAWDEMILTVGTNGGGGTAPTTPVNSGSGRVAFRPLAGEFANVGCANEASHLSAKIYAKDGSKVKSIEMDLPTGSCAPWNGTNEQEKVVAAGMYVAKGTMGSRNFRSKFVVLK